MRAAGALILAAGGSTRFGEPKQFVRVSGETLLRRAATAAHAADCSPIVVVAGDFADRTRAELCELPIQIVQNAHWRSGMGSSIRAGVAQLRDAASAIVIVACDQPFVTAQTIRRLCDADEAIVASGYANTVGIPALFESRYFDALASLSDEAGAKALIEAHAADVGVVPFPDGAIDIDTRADYDALGHLRSEPRR